MPAAAAAAAAKTVVRTPYANLLSVARWSAVVVGVVYGSSHAGTLQKQADAEKAARAHSTHVVHH